MRVVLGAAVLAAVAARGQEKPPAFPAGVEMVTVDVVVVDRQGRPVPGLTASDFAVFENGRVQAVSSFEGAAPGDRLALAAPWAQIWTIATMPEGREGMLERLATLEGRDRPGGLTGIELRHRDEFTAKAMEESLLALAAEPGRKVRALGGPAVQLTWCAATAASAGSRCTSRARDGAFGRARATTRPRHWNPSLGRLVPFLQCPSWRCGR